MSIKNQERYLNKRIKLSIKLHTIKVLLSIILYKITLDLSYYFLISKVWRYSKFFLDLNYFKLFESNLLLLIIFIFVLKTKKNLSNIVIWILILLSYIPMLTLYSFMNQSRMYMYAITLFWILISLFLSLPTLHFISFKKNQSKLIFFSITTIMFLMVLILIFQCWDFSINLNLAKVYEIRSIYGSIKPMLSGYIFIWISHIVNPVIFVMFYNKKKWSIITLIVILQIILFSITGLKTFLFALPFVLALERLLKSKNLFVFMSLGLVVIILLGMLSYYVFNNIWLSSLFTRRTLLVPAQLSFLYYDFFSNNSHTFLSQHRLFRNFINYPYELSPAHLIGKVYFNRPEKAANNGIYADAYMNFGYFGFILWGLLLIIILRILDRVSNNKDLGICVAAIAIPTISLTNGALLTCFLTHGLFLSLILLYFFPKERINKIRPHYTTVC